MLLVFSDAANNSKHVRNEVERAFNHQLVIMLFRIQNIMPSQAFEYFLGPTHWMDATEGNLEDHFEELYKNCATVLEKDYQPAQETQQLIKTADPVQLKNPA